MHASSGMCSTTTSTGSVPPPFITLVSVCMCNMLTHAEDSFVSSVKSYVLGCTYGIHRLLPRIMPRYNATPTDCYYGDNSDLHWPRADYFDNHLLSRENHTDSVTPTIWKAARSAMTTASTRPRIKLNRALIISIKYSLVSVTITNHIEYVSDYLRGPPATQAVGLHRASALSSLAHRRLLYTQLYIFFQRSLKYSDRHVLIRGTLASLSTLSSRV
jgi:hypothetical protein